MATAMFAETLESHQQSRWRIPEGRSHTVNQLYGAGTSEQLAVIQLIKIFRRVL
jgi:hypothetical protein